MRFLVFTIDGKTHIVDAHAEDVKKLGILSAVWWVLHYYTKPEIVEAYRWPFGEPK